MASKRIQMYLVQSGRIDNETNMSSTLCRSTVANFMGMEPNGAAKKSG